MAPIVILFAVLAVGVGAKENNLPTEASKRAELRIVHGEAAQEGQFPWQAWVQCIRLNFLATGCGGSLVSDRHVLTAAHCVNRVLLCQLSLGLTSLKDKGYSYFLQPKDLLVHGNYNAGYHVNDIAIIRLRSPIKLTENIQPIRLPKEFQNSETLEGVTAIISGWGKGGEGEKVKQEHLQFGIVKIMSQNICKKIFMNAFELQINDGQICIDGSQSNVCNGDSGGPLAVLEEDTKWTLVGIVSLGVAPCDSGMPSVFTAVAAYLSWIKENTGA